jgi:hypothetical protein
MLFHELHNFRKCKELKMLFMKQSYMYVGRILKFLYAIHRFMFQTTY